MSNQITLAFTVNVSGTSYGPVKAASALAAVPLYENPNTDPVLGQLFGLTVASDMTTTPTAATAVRTIVLNMTATPPISPPSPLAPPPFPCSPITATPPVPPYPLWATKTLPGNFLTTPGSPTVGLSFKRTSWFQGAGMIVQFLDQPGVFYTTAASVGSHHHITLTTPYSGPFSRDGGAVQMIQAPATIAAIYSTSPLDSAGVAIAPPLVPGSGARTVSLTYMDSTGAGPFTVTVSLMGTYPSPVTLAGGSKDIAVITDLHIVTTGGFGNSVGQITLCELLSASPYIRPDATAEDFQEITDKAQLLITRGLVYLPPSYFALCQQGASCPVLAGEFTLPGRMAHASNVQGGTSVATTVNPADQTPALVAGNVVEFAAQPGVLYTLKTVGTGTVTLTTPYTGLNDNPISSSATVVSAVAGVPPSSAQLASSVAEFVNPGTAVPPPSQPLAPQTMSPAPVFLSGMFARTLQLELAVPVVPSAIVLS
jgi:hypothetical protein